MSSHIGFITIDVNDMDVASEFWSQALQATSIDDNPTFRKLIIPGSQLAIFLQLVPEPKASKTRMHLDLVSDDVDAEATRLQKLGAKIQRKPATEGFKFAVMQDPFGNEFCILSS
ncbi:MAG TPA: VOC family protein [Candidatus Nanoarchaeia archaeon]|nr:VOC family protein [Candidatus Nanoarchaeia archaeon]